MGSLIVLQDKHHQSQARFPSRDWLSAGFLAAKSATRGWEGLAGTGRAGTGSPLVQKVTPTIKLSPLFPPPPPTPPRKRCVPLCRVPQPLSLSGRFAVVLRRHGEGLIGFVVTS